MGPSNVSDRVCYHCLWGSLVPYIWTKRYFQNMLIFCLMANLSYDYISTHHLFKCHLNFDSTVRWLQIKYISWACRSLEIRIRIIHGATPLAYIYQLIALYISMWQRVTCKMTILCIGVKLGMSQNQLDIYAQSFDQCYQNASSLALDFYVEVVDRYCLKC